MFERLIARAWMRDNKFEDNISRLRVKDAEYARTSQLRHVDYAATLEPPQKINKGHLRRTKDTEFEAQSLYQTCTGMHGRGSETILDPVKA